MPAPSTERVRAASAAWIFVPPSAPRIETEEYLLLRCPDWFEHPVQLVSLTPRRPVADVLAEVVARAREYVVPSLPSTSQLVCWARLGALTEVESAFIAAGGVLDETLDVLALDLTGFDRGAVAPATDVELRWSDELSTFFDAADLGTEVFGGTATDRTALEVVFPGEVEKHRSGGGGAVVAYLNGRAVGSGGLTLVDGDARLWGGAVLPDARGRGVYRALLAARLDYAQRHGGDLALVKARVQTSGPILRRAGFAAYGRERSWLVDLG